LHINIRFTAQFWDVVVVTAVDEEQHSFYTHQLNEKRKQNQIPTNIRYHVISDPPGTKIGCGGSTMYVLEFLEDQYDNELDSRTLGQKIQFIYFLFKERFFFPQ